MGIRGSVKAPVGSEDFGFFGDFRKREARTLGRSFCAGIRGSVEAPAGSEDFVVFGSFRKREADGKRGRVQGSCGAWAQI